MSWTDMIMDGRSRLSHLKESREDDLEGFRNPVI